MPSIRILIADDETLLRRLIRHKLSEVPGFEVIGEATNGRQAVELALELRPDVCLMDLRMPILNGAQATERIVTQLPRVRVVIITSFPELASLGKPWGASGCLDKCCTPEELVAAIRQAHAAEAPVPPHELTTVRDHGTTIRRLAIRASLTEREQMVVEKVVTTELTIREIAMALSSDLNEPVTSSAVTHTLERAMTKLRISPRTRTALVKHVLALSANVAGEPASLAPPEWEAFPVSHRSGAAFAS